MKTAVLVLTRDKSLAALVNDQKAALLAAEARGRLVPDRHSQVAVTAICVAPGDGVEQHLVYIQSFVSGHDCALLVCEHGIAVSTRLREAFFLVFFESGEAKRNAVNYFRKISAKAVRYYMAYLVLFDDAKYQKVLLLPLQNFGAAQIRDLRALFARGDLASDFSNALRTLLAGLLARERPKHRSSFDTRYFVDDQQRHFQYGHEKHARPDSAMPPHDIACALKAEFRFGRRFGRPDEAQRHFNVSEPGELDKISGDFIDCHGKTRPVKPCTHVNMFPNDFF